MKRVRQVGTYGTMVVDSLQPREGREGRVAAARDNGSKATRAVTGRLT